MIIKIKNKTIFIACGIFILGGIFFLGNWLFSQDKSDINKNQEGKIIVFKSLTCECCQGYIDYLKEQGFQLEVKNTQDMLSIKEKYQIPSNLESCHTALIGDYFVEGHVPIEAIKKLISEKPDILGIALPGMPQGSPGMGGIKKGSFEIYGLKNGQASEFGKF